MNFGQNNPLILIQFLRYIFFAGFATIVDLALLLVLTEYIGVWYFFSAIISYLAGMVVNYTVNKYLNFHNHSRKIVWQFGLFVIVASIGLALNQAILYGLVEYVGLWYLYAKLIAVCLVVFWSFNAHRLATFRLLR